MIKVLFVCHGNICRSPMAEFVLKDMVAKRRLEDHFEIASAATSREEIGNPVYPPAKKKLAEHGIRCDGKRARQMTAKDYAYYDMIIGMDDENMYYMKRMWPEDPEGKLSLLMDHTKDPREVSDPWYTRDFDKAYSDILEGCESLLSIL